MKHGIIAGTFICISVFALEMDPQANLLKRWKLYGKPETTALQNDGTIACVCRDAVDVAGVTQLITLEQSEPKRLLFSVESKAQNVTGIKDNNFGIYADIVHADGSKTYGVSVPCTVGTHEWEKNELTYTPEKPIKTVNFYLLLRKKTGEAWFRNAVLIDESKPLGHGSSRPSPVGGPRIQPLIPAGYKEIPFLDENPPPEPTAEETARGFLLFTRSINQPIYAAAKPLPAERIDRLGAFAALGEYEPLNFAVHSLRDITNMRVTVSELRNINTVISSNNLDLRLVTEWNIRYPNYTSKGTYRRMPELLESVAVNSFPRNESRRYWLLVHVPADASPGLYRGTVSIADDRSRMTTLLPITLRVLGFRLLRDPAKHYSVYQGYPLGDIPDHLTEKAMSNDIAAMQAYGIDMCPTMSLWVPKAADGTISLSVKDERQLEALLRHGFQGPIPITGGIGSFYWKHVPTGKVSSHWAIDTVPASDAIYKDIEQTFRKFREQYSTKGYPEFICCPLDEVAPESAEFSAKVYAAIRAAGMKTYITKDPTALDAAVYRKHDAVDAWCSQPYAMPYERAVSDMRSAYWSYPNHNAGEIKDRVVMQKGGRMTYGFGFWRSGYTVLIPWNWRWPQSVDDHFDYLRANGSGCGNRMDELGNFIPAVYWECFREGYDDARYIYTLQQAIFAREGTADAHCAAAMVRGKALLQKLWDDIVPQQKYLSTDLWADEQFTAARWHMATLIDELLRFPAVRTGEAPSVMVDTKKNAAEKIDAFGDAAKKGLLETCDLGGEQFLKWEAVNTEVTMNTVPADDGSRPLLRMNVKVDHTVDGGGETGKYPIGWPRIRREFVAGEFTLNDCDYLSFMIRIDSDRDEVADDATPMIVSIQSHQGGHDGFKGDVHLDLGDRQRTWLPVRISIRDLIRRSGHEAPAWRELKAVQFVITEANYKDGTHLSFDIDRIALVKVKQPIIESVESTDTLLLPAPYMDIAVTGMGMATSAADGFQLRVDLIANGVIAATRTTPLAASLRTSLDVRNVSTGAYLLETRVLDKNGAVASRMTKAVIAMTGFSPDR